MPDQTIKCPNYKIKGGILEMVKKTVDQVICDNCKFEIATVYIEEDGLKHLAVHEAMGIKIVDKENNVGIIACPKCGSELTTDLSFWNRF